MKTTVPDYLQTMITNTRDAFCDTLHNPQLWSETLAKRTLERIGSNAFNINDVQMIIKDYVSVLSEAVRKGETL
jgi:hypothetical protein